MSLECAGTMQLAAVSVERLEVPYETHEIRLESVFVRGCACHSGLVAVSQLLEVLRWDDLQGEGLACV